MTGESTQLDEMCAAFEKQVTEASTMIAPYAVRTPTVRLPWLDTAYQQFWAKLECWQLSGSVMIRAAIHAIASLAPNQHLVTVSDSSHALAVATAAQKLRHPCTVVVQTNASAIRVRRFAELGAQVEVAGATASEATIHARALATRDGLPFIAPFGDTRSAASVATCLDEAFCDVGSFDNVIAPHGNGMLLAGVGALAKARYPQTKVIATHPPASRRAATPSPLPKDQDHLSAPTLAGRLAPQHQVDETLAHLLQLLPITPYEVDEPTVAQGIFALLYRQSLLVSGSGAAAVGALLNRRLEVTDGRTLIILTGSNIGTTELARVFSVEIPDPGMRHRLGLRGRTTALNAAAQVRQRFRSNAVTEASTSASPTVDTDCGSTPHLPDLEGAASLLQAHRSFAETIGLSVSAPAHNALDEVLAVARDLHSQMETDPTPEDEDSLRLLHRLTGFMVQSMEWASAAHDQSGRINFFNPETQQPNLANYARYGDPALRALELNLADTLGFRTDDVELLMTSSGMAAYQLIESYLLRYVVRPGDAIVCPPYIYFEAREQLTALPFLHHIQASSYQVCDLVEAVEAHHAKVLFVDPVANVAGLPKVDLRGLASEVVDNPAWAERWIVIDGTMISGGLDLAALFPTSAYPRVLYYESASKHAQMGLDLTMAGICVIPTTMSASMRTQRRNTGSVLYPDAVARFPRTTRNSFLTRMRRMSNNAALFASTIGSVASITNHATVAVIDDWAERGWQHGGSVVTLSFRRNGMNNRDVLESFVERLLRTARVQRISLVRGVSFGLSTSRVSTASSTAQFHDPFVRFSLGTESSAKIVQLGLLTADVVAGHLDLYGEEVASG